MPPDKPDEKPADKPADKPAGGDTTPADSKTGDQNPLFKALFDSAPPPEEKKSDDEPAPGPGQSLLAAMSGDGKKADEKKDEKPADKKDEKPGDKKDEKPGDKKPDEKPADKKDEKPPVKLTRRLKKEDEKPADTPPPPKPADKKPEEKKPDTKPEDSLEPEEREQYELLVYAEKNNKGDKFKGAPAKFLDFVKKHTDFIAKKKGEDADYDFSKDNPEYQAWLKANMPPAVNLTSSERRQLERDQDRAAIRSEVQGELSKAKDEQAKREIIPQVKRAADTFFAEVSDLGTPAELKALIKEKGYDEAKKLMPDEYEIVEETTAALAEHMEQFSLMSNRVIPFNPANQVHKQIDDFITFQCDDFAKNGGDLRNRAGKTFVTRIEWAALTPEQRAAHWTFSNADVVTMMKEIAKPTIEAKIKDRLEKLKGRGWVRQPAAAKADEKKADDKKPDEKPEEGAAKVRPAPAGGSQPSEDPGSNTVMKVLGLT